MERTLDQTVPGIGHSLISGLDAAGQWFGFIVRSTIF